MNQIIKGFLNEHVNEYGISSYEEKDAFEHFINRCIVTKYTLERFDPNDIMTDSGEIGLDGVAIIINHQVVTSIEEAQIIYSQNTSIDVNYIFIQAKRSESFDGAEMSTFTKGVRHFFEDTGDFESVDYQPYDQNQIITLYKEMRRKIQKEFIMEKRMPFFSMPGIKEAYFGLVKCTDIVSMLTDEQGHLFNNIFEDNVRDFQGYNPVNSEIKNTICNTDSQKRFAVLNNGITIIAKDIRTEGDKIRIFDYQIVNGCQTSHVLFDNSLQLTPSSYILTKIIRVENEDVLDQIVYTSNRQTEVKYEAFTSANRFHKMLQEYYNSIDVNFRLFYERRSKQYDMDSSINKIISLAA